ncbi:uncharacterized protein TRAVEDRAFT_22643 [Trametes versicolor FP-101664 SS1]|uniref:uncharacterized protein n=1 Tax=Trametes versicolor (strain FP-101664) TaxID=717944 RepID=UPI0004624721|nr:uncharacterized protein TRAVEDRAFT_22643 [Trametes versicolor FP-101664 SS1]EIW54737.1 hypothetical protein TRAVEDRAFT_22643 [Trametes versicolor FP-101664 SS1]
MPLRTVKSVHFADSDDIVPSPPPSSKAPTRLPPVLGLGLELGPARESVEIRPRRDATVPLPEVDWAEGGAGDGQGDSPRGSSTSAGSDDSYPTNALGLYASANEYPNTHQGHAAYTPGGVAYPFADAAHSRSLGVPRDDAWSSSSASSQTPSPPPPTSPIHPNLHTFPYKWDLRNGDSTTAPILDVEAFPKQVTKCVLVFRPPIPPPIFGFKVRVEAPWDGYSRHAISGTDILTAIEKKLHGSRNASFITETMHPHWYKAAEAARASCEREPGDGWQRVDLWPAAPHLYFLGLEPAGFEEDGTMICVVKLGTAPPPKARAL